MNKKFIILVCIFLIAACKSPYSDPHYKHQTKKFSTPFADTKKTLELAQKSAKKDLRSFSIEECRRLAYGWYLKEITVPGELICEETDGGHHCRYTSMELKCEQLDEKTY